MLLLAICFLRDRLASSWFLYSCLGVLGDRVNSDHIHVLQLKLGEGGGN